MSYVSRIEYYLHAATINRFSDEIIDRCVGQSAPHRLYGRLTRREIRPGVTVADNVTIRAFCHIEGTTIGSGATVGPFARLRPGASLAEAVHSPRLRAALSVHAHA